MRRRTLSGPVLAAALALLAFGAGVLTGQARSQAPPRVATDTVVDLVTDQLPRTARVRANVNRWEPGSETGRHTHPGPTVFVVLEGQLEEVFPDGRTRTLGPGQGHWKPPRTEHNVRNAGPRPARALAVHLDPVR